MIRSAIMAGYPCLANIPPFARPAFPFGKRNDSHQPLCHLLGDISPLLGEKNNEMAKHIAFRKNFFQRTNFQTTISLSFPRPGSGESRNNNLEKGGNDRGATEFVPNECLPSGPRNHLAEKFFSRPRTGFTTFSVPRGLRQELPLRPAGPHSPSGRTQRRAEPRL